MADSESRSRSGSDAEHALVARAVEAIDAINSADPVSIEVDGEARPKELVHAERMTHWLTTLDPAATAAQLIAARAHHLRRWARASRLPQMEGGPAQAAGRGAG